MGVFKVIGGVATPLLQKKKASYETTEKEHSEEDPYWYKIDGKKVSRYIYLKYENKPGEMEGGGKTTNNPDVYGRKCGGSPSDPKVCPKEKKEKKDE